MEKLRVGVLSTGNIAATMAETLRCMEDVELYAVAPDVRRRQTRLQKNTDLKRHSVHMKRWQQMRR